MYQGRFMWERYSVIIKYCLWLKMQQNCLNSGPLKRKNLVKLSGLHIKCVEPFLPYFPDGLRLWGCWLCLRTGHLRLPENQTMLSRVHDPQVPKLIAIKRLMFIEGNSPTDTHKLFWLLLYSVLQMKWAVLDFIKTGLL